MIKEAKSWDDMSDEAKDLVLHADNDRHLFNSSHKPIVANLAKKKARNIYDADLATKLWGYHADRAAISATKTHGDDNKPWHKMFPKGIRKEAAAHWEALHRDDLEHEHKRHVMSESEGFVDIEDIDQEKVTYFEMMDNVINKNIIDFKEKFNDVLVGKIEEAVANFKSNLTDHVFNDNLNEISSELLGKYIKKSTRNHGSAVTGSNAIHASIHQEDRTGLDEGTFAGRMQGVNLDEKWNSDYETPKSKRGMFKGRSLSSLEKQDKNVSGTKKKEVDFAIRAKTGWGKVKD